MVLVRKQLDINVVEGARLRIINAFNNGLPVYLGISGGKDSTVMAALVYDLIIEEKVDPKQLVIDFIDEEAIYEDMERVVKEWRTKFILAGAHFRWWCIEVVHFNCFNELSEDESFICWDSEKKDVWVRAMPDFALTDHPLLNRRKDSYQAFLPKIEKDGVVIMGARASESVQRLYAISISQSNKFLWPIYDWRDSDIWRYIQEYNVDFAKTYMQMYQVGVSRNQMRISQFFSVDTAKSLVKMSEHNPGLMERITKREPNAYLAALYFDSELFRGSKRQKKLKDGQAEEKVDYKEKVWEYLANPKNYSSPVRIRNIKEARRMLTLRHADFNDKAYQQLYNLLVGGDPKDRAVRAVKVLLAKNSWDRTVNDEA